MIKEEGVSAREDEVSVDVRGQLDLFSGGSISSSKLHRKLESDKSLDVVVSGDGHTGYLFTKEFPPRQLRLY